MTIRAHELILAAAGAAVLACGASAPSQELVQARQSYEEARQGPAAELAPSSVVDAGDALALAEEARRLDAGEETERHLAYLAWRQAQIALQQGELARAYRDKRRAQATYQQTLVEQRRAADARRRQANMTLEKARAELAEVRSQLDDKEGALDERTRALQQREQELVAVAAELLRERAARQQAEQQFQAAMTSLEEIARVREEERETIITLDGAVLFKFDTAELLPMARQKLDRVAEALLDADNGSERAIRIEGHTDAQGAKQYNQELSQRRARTVSDYLISRGVPPDRIIAVGKGEQEPVADNRTPEGRANNRRVEIVVPRA